jgi:hypothetical protein
MLHKLDKPYYTSSKVPEEIADDLNIFKDLCWEYVYYRYMFIDRIDRCDNGMIKSVTMVSDTDSTIISLDAWYRFIVNQINGEELKIANYTKDPSIADEDDNEELEAKVLDYNFHTDEIVEVEKASNPDIIPPNDNVRYSIISIIGYVLDRTVNDYMKKMCSNQYSVKDPYHPVNDCRIYSKNEFLFKRLMMVPHAKKNYASLIEVQEGNIVPEDKQLDVKGIEAIHKSSKPLSTRKALQKILLEDILKAPVIDQLKFIKDIAILQNQIYNSIKSGSKEFYKPATVKAISAYDDPLRIQGVKASIAWNMIKPANVEAININERNAVDIAKVNINRANMNDIADTYPEVYENIKAAFEDEIFKSYTSVSKTTKKYKDIYNKVVIERDPEFTSIYKLDPSTGDIKKYSGSEITAVAIPLDMQLPPWLEPFIDYDSIIADNLNGFPYESIGIQRMERNNVNYTNIVQL